MLLSLNSLFLSSFLPLLIASFFSFFFRKQAIIERGLWGFLYYSVAKVDLGAWENEQTFLRSSIIRPDVGQASLFRDPLKPMEFFRHSSENWCNQKLKMCQLFLMLAAGWCNTHALRRKTRCYYLYFDPNWVKCKHGGVPSRIPQKPPKPNFEKETKT